ncbi:MAG: hypothetical protein AAGC70_12405 [Pseudomonadota bacterium]
MRQCLVEIRRALGADRDAIRTNNLTVSLDPTYVDVDWRDWQSHADTDSAAANVELLEGLDIRDPEFEDWLRKQRRALEAQLERPCAHDVDRDTGRAASTSSELLILSNGPDDKHANDNVIGDCLLDAISKTVAEVAAVSVVDYRNEPDRLKAWRKTATNDRSLVLQSAVTQAPGDNALRVVLTRERSNQVVWSARAGWNGKDSLHVDSERFSKLVNQVANIAVSEYLKLHTEDESKPVASALCKMGIQHFFRLGADNFEIADQYFKCAFELEPKGIYLGWRAYLRTFMLAEQQFACRETLTDEAVDFITRALELDPHNSYIASFAAQVHYLVNRSYVAAYEYAERSIELNEANSVGWIQLGMAKCYLGRLQAGVEDTRRAVQIAGTSPFRFHLAGLSCIASSMSGQVDQAIHLGEASHALKPNFAPAMRYLSVLYLHKGDEQRAWAMVEKLRAREPGFSYDRLKDPSYPAAGLHRSGLIRSLPARQI